MSRCSRALLALAAGVPLFAQEPTVTDPAETAIGLGTEPLPGKVPGTSRYNVTFAARPFDLEGFRSAIESGANAAAMERITADLQQRAIAHQEPFRKAILAMGGRVDQQFWLINACTIEITKAQVATVRALANVLLVDPDLPAWHQILTATNASNHNADAVQAAGITATGFAVAINDSGQDSNMNGLGRPHRTYYRGGNIGNTTAGGLNGSRLLANVQLGSQPADDAQGHGTGVAGIAAGEVWGNAAADRGHANDAFLVGYSMCNGSNCSTSLSIEATAWQRCAADKVRYNIVAANMSYSSSNNPADISQQAIDAAALNASIVPCISAGNGGSSTASSPGACNALAVAACSANSKAIASFSSRGPLSSDTARFFPDITACGVSTVMPARNNETGNFTASGTSMASPQVAGAAALVKAARPASSAREIKAILLASTDSIASQNASLNRNAYGMGFLRDDRAVALAQRPGAVLTDGIASTSVPKTHLISVSLGQQYAVCLVFFRHVLTATAFSNLNLRVLDGANVVASSSDLRNLYEKVTFTAPFTGILTVEVSAVSLEVNPLPYSLATTATFIGLAPAAWANAGAGCPGTRGIPSLFPNANPVLGTTFVSRIAYAPPSTLCFFMLGFSNTTSGGSPLPLNLAGIGAPNCFLRTDIVASDAVVTDVNGTAAMNYPLPNVLALLGGPVFQQVMAFDPPANALQFTISNAGSFTIGQY